MKELIKPTTKPQKDKDGNEIPTEYILEDKDFLLITAINNLANEIQKMRMTNGR